MRVGAVIPVREPAPYLDEAVASVLAERPDDVVVVDDGSRQPIAVAGARVVRRDVAGGPAAARNAGIAALGDVDLVAFCDADDAWSPGSLGLRVAALAAHPDAAGAFGRARIVGSDGDETGEAWPLPPAGPYADAAALYAHNPILTSSVVLRRAHARFDESYAQAEDWELWLRLLRDGHALLCVPDAEVRYRRHPGGVTADVLTLARAQQRLHEAHAGLVPAAVRDRVAARDRAGLAAGLLRAGRYAEARAHMPGGWRRALAAVPGLRRALGRRAPY